MGRRALHRCGERAKGYARAAVQGTGMPGAWTLRSLRGLYELGECCDGRWPRKRTCVAARVLRVEERALLPRRRTRTTCLGINNGQRGLTREPTSVAGSLDSSLSMAFSRLLIGFLGWRVATLRHASMAIELALLLHRLSLLRIVSVRASRKRCGRLWLPRPRLTSWWSVFSSAFLPTCADCR